MAFVRHAFLSEREEKRSRGHKFSRSSLQLVLASALVKGRICNAKDNSNVCAENVLTKNGAGDGNRTHVASLEGWSSTIELHPHLLYKNIINIVVKLFMNMIFVKFVY